RSGRRYPDSDRDPVGVPPLTAAEGLMSTRTKAVVVAVVSVTALIVCVAAGTYYVWLHYPEWISERFVTETSVDSSGGTVRRLMIGKVHHGMQFLIEDPADPH